MVPGQASYLSDNVTRGSSPETYWMTPPFIKDQYPGSLLS